MNSSLTIPHGNETIQLELTVKEAMALGSGVRFGEAPKLAGEARRKIRESLESKLITNNRKIEYHELGL